MSQRQWLLVVKWYNIITNAAVNTRTELP